MVTVKLTTEKFKEDIFDYTSSQEWKYKGDVPAIIDFYADWCGPCKAIAPVLEELAEAYKDDLVIYKVDTEVEQELAAVFRIMSIPSILFIPVDRQPMMQKGALPKHVLKQIIETELIKDPVTEEQGS